MTTSPPLLIHLDYCLTPTTRINNAAIVIRDGKIAAVGGFSAFVDLENFQVIRLPACYALPGLVDTRLYGAAGFDCMHADSSDGIATMSTALAAHGVTSFLPTTQSAEREHMLKVISALAGYCHQPLPGAVAVGISIEGPYVSLARRGAHPQRYIRPIDLEEAKSFIAAGAGHVRMFTFAPELDNAGELLTLLKEHGIIACMGHTTAQQDHVEAAILAGANRVSHVFNGMDPLQQRRVGVAALALVDDRLWVELIPDGVHVHPGMIDLACRCKPRNKLVCISNSTEAAGLHDGTYKLGEDTIFVRRGRATLHDGTIAGSVNFLDQNYQRMLSFSQLTQMEVAACFTLNAARSIKLTDRGEIKPGKRADLVVLDRQHRVRMTIVNGDIVYQVQPEEAALAAT